MKKIVSLLVILVIASCTTDVTTNNPGYQGYRDNVLFRSISSRAYLSASGQLRLEGLAQDETLNLKTVSAAVGTYYLGTTVINNSANYMSKFSNQDLSYATDVVAGAVANIQKPFASLGTGYVSGTGIATTTTGNGVGLTVKLIVNSSGVITDIKISSPGNNYLSGDLITVTGGNGQTKFRVLNVEGSNGEIIIAKNDGVTVSGTFKFNAVKSQISPFGNDLLNFQYGEFYKIPIFPEP